MPKKIVVGIPAQIPNKLCTFGKIFQQDFMDNYSFLGSVHGAFIESVYEQYTKDPDSVQATWRSFFQGYDFAREIYEDTALEESIVPEEVYKEFKVINLINAYRSRGHLFTQTNPVRERRKYRPTLDLANFGLSEEDLDIVFQAGNECGLGATTLRDIVNHLKQVYCQSIGVEYMYIREEEELEWIKNKLHQNGNQAKFSTEEKKTILRKLNQAVAFENFLHTKYVGQKRFSLEGAESLIPALNAVIEKGANLGVRDFVMGMAHRGRLNVLANIFNKTYREIFTEFEGKDYDDALFDGDVKYHLGYSCKIKTDQDHEVEMNLAPNPSHLEAVDPVVEGIARAKIDEAHKGKASKVLPIQIHGDAAIAAQGVVYEVIQMAQLEGYNAGGTLHIVVNNQIGFTTNYLDARSSTYCTDVAKTTLSPVLHVNGDDVEAVVHAMEFAIEYRQKFGKDVFIDLLCYRKYGHNEGDEPRFTQPLLYKAISKHPNPREIYNKKLVEQDVIGASIVKEMEQEFRQMLEGDLEEAKAAKAVSITPFMQDAWGNMRESKPDDFLESPETGFSIKQLKEIAKVLYTNPEGKKLFKKTEKLLRDRKKMVEESNKLDWGMAELLAYGTLVAEGHNVRISGQDVERGTFSHRHAILRVEESEEEISPLSQISENQGRFEIFNSLLSEYAVVGFEYGYAMTNPNNLIIWEAQFGDFSNGAQIMIDQFISAAEDKWKNQNGLVMLLPHGYEGQGAEHSSARLERYLQLCAEFNMQVCNPTTPANHFHLLRRQMSRPFRKPLVVMTPKSLLRHPRCTSGLEDLAVGRFQEVIDDPASNPEKVKKIVFVSGKLYYELEKRKEELEDESTAIVRLEQIYPLPRKQMDAIRLKYTHAESLVWAQEEPANMGSWSFILTHSRDLPWELVAREPSASPASGSGARAAQRQERVISEVFSHVQNEKN